MRRKFKFLIQSHFNWLDVDCSTYLIHKWDSNGILFNSCVHYGIYSSCSRSAFYDFLIFQFFMFFPFNFVWIQPKNTHLSLNFNLLLWSHFTYVIWKLYEYWLIQNWAERYIEVLPCWLAFMQFTTFILLL